MIIDRLYTNTCHHIKIILQSKQIKAISPEGQLGIGSTRSKGEAVK